MTSVQYRPDRPSLLGSRLKLKRAGEQLDELEPVMRAYIDREPYVFPSEPEAEDDWMVFRILEVREYPDPRWGVRIGEFLHDLRSALDNLVWQLVLLNGETPGDHNQFPIFTDTTRPPRPARLPALRTVPGATRIDDMLYGVAPEHAATIKSLQPYLGLHIHRHHKVALGSLADLNNIDKHRFVHPAVGVTERGEGGLAEHVAGPAPSSIEVEFTIGAIYPGAELYRWRVIGGSSDTKVTMEGSIPYDVAFGHPNTTLSHLDWLCERITEVVERFGSSFQADQTSTS
jgi:hypothetical protein